MEGSFDLDRELPVALAAMHAPAASPSASSNGHIVSGQQPHPSEPDGLAALAQFYHQKHILHAPPVEQPEVEMAGEQQAVPESNGWPAEESHSDCRQQLGDSNHTGLAISHCSGSRELVPSSSAQDIGREPLGCEGQDVPVSPYIAQTNGMPGQLASHSAEPLLMGRKRPLNGDDHDEGQDSIVAKKQCLAMSGPI